MTPLGRLVVLLAVLVLSACGASSSDTAADPTSAPSSPSPSEPAGGSPKPRPGHASMTPTEVPETLAFSATTVDGQAFEGSSLVGRPALLWFWAPWCPTCRSQIPEVEGYAADHADQLAVVGVGSLDSADAIAAFADEVEGVTHLEDTEGALYRKFGIAEQSSFVLLDETGAVVFETGYGGSDQLAAEVDDVLG